MTRPMSRKERAAEEAVKQFGRIDVLVNNAGYSLLGNFEEMTTAEIERQFATNFYSSGCYVPLDNGVDLVR